MRSYTVPPDMKEKEKIIGGVININQFFWLLGGFVLGAVLFIVSFLITKSAIFSIILALIGAIASTPFAFYKKLDLPLYTYLKRKREFKNKTHKLINQRKGVGK